MPFKISKKYFNDKWTDLGLTEDNGDNWAEGILIIKDRFDSPFFNHLDNIKNDEFSGFVIMSIDCLLIETLMQFYLGVDNTEINYSGENWKAFRDFLKQSSHFNTYFKTNKICNVFYQQFRCGLLHQAQTKQKSLIKVCQPDFVILADTTNVDKGLIIDRIQFHQNLVLEFEEYIEKLKTNETNFKGENLRLKAITKMDLICAE
ncbi:hypothetical protein [Dyadobacter psychrotolerans]|uniref:Uncharacterized protein n=1 Tax=Dyadobacter psychrotolerans TaxID=2541721 RepID=A0A4R5DPH1_9BACT|nr:hypothetical protein [Dyadobacter psychrotolerans]TDE16149.1 hypothetical protein E0F88_07800 [Dyadobacter psychrotolerans]